MSDIATKCAVCGNHITAGRYPPVCSVDCYRDWRLECEYNRWAKREVEEYERPPYVPR